MESAGIVAIGTDYIIELAEAEWFICWVCISVGVFLYPRADIMGTPT